MKRCNLKNCDAEHEGVCTLDLDRSAKSDDDLITEEEWIEYPIKDFLKSKKAQKNYENFFNKLVKLQKGD